jgi:putative transposase
MTARQGRRKIDAGLKAKVALAAIREKETAAEISSTYKVHASQISRWKKQAIEELSTIFTEGGGNRKPSTIDEKLQTQLYEEIGRLKMEVNWLKKKLERLQ